MSEQTSSHHRLGLTARWTAGARARESQREDRLFNDPWARLLAGEEGKEWTERQSADRGASVIVRTRFFDDFLQRATVQHALRQIVLVAAGLDTRASRITWPEHTRFFELDQPHVLEYKEQVLTEAGAQPTCERKTLPVDLTTSWREALVQAGFQSQQSSVWLIEGFLHYLPNEHIARLLDEITSLAAPGSWLGFDIINGTMLTSPWTQSIVKSMTAAGMPWIGWIDDPEADLAALGWRATLAQPGEEGVHYGRWPYPAIPQMMPDMPRYWLVTAQKN
jgi:methyltransferase (TIGR00027 family)